MALNCVRYTKSITKDDPTQQGTTWNLMFSPEAYSDRRERGRARAF
jgi:2-isopropylmalate synthase